MINEVLVGADIVKMSRSPGLEARNPVITVNFFFPKSGSTFSERCWTLATILPPRATSICLGPKKNQVDSTILKVRTNTPKSHGGVKK